MNISLYNLIKQKSQEKGRPLKIIADWDECLFSFRATAIYRIGECKKPFKEFFEEFWEEAPLDLSGYYVVILVQDQYLFTTELVK